MILNFEEFNFKNENKWKLLPLVELKKALLSEQLSCSSEVIFL